MDPVAALVAALAVAATEAWSSVDRARRCHLPFDTFSAVEAAGINAFDVLGHTRDLAVATETGVDAADELWEAGLAAARVVLAPGRDPAHYGPERALAGGAGARARFLAYLGRVTPGATEG